MSFTAEYSGKEAHASAFPWMGIKLDALITEYNAISILRQQQTMPGGNIRVILRMVG
jgi:metal-dependent amidase/aminoacylase/carboxypeptidase family protein